MASPSSSTHPILSALSRRSFLKGLSGSAALLWTTASGCGYFPAEEGAAYEPWNFPGGEDRPEYLAVGAAILASNPHNTQPWLFRITPERIDLYADMSKSLGAMDGLHREMTIGLGCALENLVWAADAVGRRADVTLMPDEAADPTWVASVALSQATPNASALYEAIPKRHTNRGRYANVAPPAELEGALRERVFEPEVHLTFLTDDADRRSFRSGTIDATKAIINDREMNHDSHVWYRHTQEELERNRDGLTLDATGQGSTIRVLGKVTGRPTADQAGQYWLDSTRDAQTTGSAFCILSTLNRDSRVEQLLCGRAYQRLHLWATTVGLAMQPLNQMAERQDREQILGLEPRFTNLLHGLIGSDQMGAQMLFRVGYPWDDALSSPRRPIEWVTR